MLRVLLALEEAVSLPCSRISFVTLLFSCGFKSSLLLYRLCFIFVVKREAIVGEERGEEPSDLTVVLLQ